MGRRNRHRKPAAAGPGDLPAGLAGSAGDAADDAELAGEGVATLEPDAPAPGFSPAAEQYPPGRDPHTLLAMEGMNVGRAAPGGIKAVPAGAGMADELPHPEDVLPNNGRPRGLAPAGELPQGDPDTHRGLVLPKTATPGIAAPRGGTPALPRLEFIHAADVCPQLFPVASRKHPGMFVDRKTGKPVLPPLNNKPQYSALLLEVENRLAPELPHRWVVTGAHAPPDSWGVDEHELAVRRVEVVFDDEQMMREYLRLGGIKNRLDDPLAYNSLGMANYDGNPNLVGGLQGTKAAALPGYE